LYLILGYPSLEVIEYIEKAVADITVDNSDLVLSTIKYKIYSISKVIQVILQQTEVDKPENSILFNKII
jgi:hypothetical protein